MTSTSTSKIFDAADIIIPIITDDDVSVFINAHAGYDKWIRIINKIFMVDPNIFTQKFNMHFFWNKIYECSEDENVPITPFTPFTLLEYYIRCAMYCSYGSCEWGTTIHTLTDNEINVIKYFLTKGASATIYISHIIEYQSKNHNFICSNHYQKCVHVSIGDIISILSDQQYQKQCTVIFNVAFDDTIKCVNVLEAYLNIVGPDPKCLSFMTAINCARHYSYTNTTYFRALTKNNRYGVLDYISICQKYVHCCEKLLKYGVAFEYDERVESIEYASAEIKDFLIEQWHSKNNNITNILMQFIPIIKFPKELIVKIIVMSLPCIVIPYN